MIYLDITSNLAQFVASPFQKIRLPQTYRSTLCLIQSLFLLLRTVQAHAWVAGCLGCNSEHVLEGGRERCLIYLTAINSLFFNNQAGLRHIIGLIWSLVSRQNQRLASRS